MTGAHKNYCWFLLLFTFLISCKKDKIDSDVTESKVNELRVVVDHYPIMIENESNDLVHLTIEVEGNSQVIHLKKIILKLSNYDGLETCASANLYFAGKSEFSTGKSLFAGVDNLQTSVEFSGDLEITEGTNQFTLSFQALEGIKLNSVINIESVEAILSIGDEENSKKIDVNEALLFAKELRAKYQDNIDTYRIPGLATTNNGTLIAVYDNRYDDRYDLQSNIDVGMSRSTDGGVTWETMKVIMDMGEWGGLSEDLNGIGDPCILVDKETNTIWVAALWLHGMEGKTVFSGSQAGLDPTVSGQLILVKSEDDGVTWSEPINITEQVKNPIWRVVFQGPGMGITMANGTLVFPVQFKDNNNLVYSSIIYSEDHGSTWSMGTGVMESTTEAQVVELSDGSLMINARYPSNKGDTSDENGRVVAVTSDMGKTWEMHSSSRNALPEPACQASIIGADLNIDGETEKVLFFFNPNNKTSRMNLTLKVSLDEGVTWPEQYQLELNSETSWGYSCLTMIDENTIGVLYEGVENLYFQKIPLELLINDIQ